MTSPRGLRFDPEVEREWHAFRDDQARGPARLGMIVFGVIIVLAGLGDEWQGYQGWQTVLLIRVALWGPMMFLGAALVSHPRLRGHVVDVTFGVALALTGSLIGTMWFVLPRSAAIDYPMYWAVLLLLVHVVAPLGLVRACGVGAFVVAGFFAVMLRYDADPAHFAAHTVFLLFAWVLLVAASWLLESRARATFLAERGLRAQTRALDDLTRLQASVLDTLSEGVCGMDARGVVTFANPAAASLLGRPASAVVGARFHDTFHDADATDPEAPCALCASGEPVQDVPARLRLPDGGTRWVECASRPNDGGHPVVRVLSFHDVGRRRELEAQVRHSQKMEAIGLFVGGVAHEFNNLLTPVLAGLELAGDALPAGHPVHDSLAHVGRAGERAAELVRQLLTLGSRLDPSPQAVDLSASVTRALTFIGPTLDRRIEMVFDPAAGAWARADPGQVDQVLLNLCLNARDALLPDVEAGRPARITLSVRAVTVDATAAEADPRARPGDWVELAVADTGPGIPPDVLPRVFEPFFTTKPRGQASGLGLAVLHGIVQGHGGWVTVETAPGAGTRIACLFPAASPPSGTRAAPVPEPSPRSRSVLVVDDEQMVREVVRRCLERLGYAVEESPGGGAALSRLHAGYRPDLVLLDIQMPDLDGWRTLASIRALDPALPVVMISGYDTDAARPHAHAPDALLRKPFRIAQLEATLGEVIARRAGV